MLQWALWLWRDLYDWTRVRGSLQGRCPAMVLALADHVWSVFEHVPYPARVGDLQLQEWAQQRNDALESPLDVDQRKKALPISWGTTDNLSTHSIGSLYGAFPPEKATEFARRLEIHYTPKDGSWLNIAEIELSVLSRQCLDRRIESIERLESECRCWNMQRNESQKGVDWRFAIEDTGIKLKRLYP